jgi:poly(A) polymerase Pap1
MYTEKNDKTQIILLVYLTTPAVPDCTVLNDEEMLKNYLEKDVHARGHGQVSDTIKFLPEGTTEKHERPGVSVKILQHGFQPQT